VRRIFRSVAEGVSVRSMRISLERDGIPAPSGIGRWNHTTIRNLIGSELYVPHAYEEVAALVEPGVAARLDKGAVYGLWTWNTRKTTRRKVWDEAAGEFKIRYNYAPRPREEWLFVPVPDAGVPRRAAGGCGGGEAEPQGQRAQALEGGQTLLGALRRHSALRRVRAHLETQQRPQEERKGVSLLHLPLPL
jgi:recombinase